MRFVNLLDLRFQIDLRRSIVREMRNTGCCLKSFGCSFQVNKVSVATPPLLAFISRYDDFDDVGYDDDAMMMML